MARKAPLPDPIYRILSCPRCRAAICYTEDFKWLRCKGCGALYPIKKGIARFI